MRLKFVRAVTLAIIASTPAAAQDTAFVKALKSYTNPFNLTAGRLSGLGADALSRVARESQFIMIGEDHGIREVPEFVAALYREAQPAGFNHIAVEIGPVSGKRLETMLRQPNGTARVNDFLGRYTSFTLPFFFWKEETVMLESIVKHGGSKPGTVWGIDQEFMMAPTYLLERLVEIAPDKQARDIAKRFAESSAKGDKALMASQNMSGVWMVATTDADVVRLRSAFKPVKGSEADIIIRELSDSRDIYRMFNQGTGYESNQTRDDMMKRHFMEHYRAAQAKGESLPKAIVKLGANHVFRGPSITSTYEIGSFLPELAASNGTRSFGILLVVAKGTWNAYRPFGSKEEDKTQKYDPLTTDEYKVFDLRSVLAAAPADSWSFIDLRPVRAMSVNGGLRRLDPLARRLLNSFDGVVVVPEGHASVYFR